MAPGKENNRAGVGGLGAPQGPLRMRIWGNEGMSKVTDGSRSWRVMNRGDMAWSEDLGSQNIWQTVMDGWHLPQWNLRSQMETTNRGSSAKAEKYISGYVLPPPLCHWDGGAALPPYTSTPYIPTKHPVVTAVSLLLPSKHRPIFGHHPPKSQPCPILPS